MDELYLGYLRYVLVYRSPYRTSPVAAAAHYAHAKFISFKFN